MQPWHTVAVRTVPVLRNAVSPSLPRLLADDPVLRSIYFSSVLLEAQTRPAARQTDDYQIESTGMTVITLQTEAWDPESRHRLMLAASDQGWAPNVTVTVVFWSELLQADWRGTLVLPRVPGHMTEVDLRQVYAFALSHRVARLRVILSEPGRYWFRLAEATP
jgi:hypothetical protein